MDDGSLDYEDDILKELDIVIAKYQSLGGFFSIIPHIEFVTEPKLGLPAIRGGSRSAVCFSNSI